MVPMEWSAIPLVTMNGSIGTNGGVECTPTQVKAIEKILNNEIHLTNGIPMDCVSFHRNPFVRIGLHSTFEGKRGVLWDLCK